MKITSRHGLAVTTAALATGALALLAGCTSGSAETPRSATDYSASTPPAHSTPPPTPPAKPTPDGPTPPASSGPDEKPVIGKVWISPGLPCDLTCTLTPAVGTVTFHAKVSDATRVQFFLVPTGTDTWGNRKSIGVDRNGEDGWSANYTYGDEPLWSHVLVVARGPGGTTEKLPFNLYHPDPR
jgi:hypothetical protein